MERASRARRASLLAAVLGSASLPLFAAPIPLEHFARDPAMAAPSISPDGSRLVFITTAAQGKPVVAVRDLATQKLTPLMGGANDHFTVRGCWFKTNERLLCSFRGTDRVAGKPIPVSRLVALNADGKGIKVLVQNGRAGSSQYQDQIIHFLPDDPEHVLLALNDNEGVFPSVYRLNVNTGGLRLVQMARPPVLTWMADRRGVVRFGYGYRNKSALYIARDDDDAPWRTLEKFNRFEHSFAPLGYSVLPNTLLVSAPHNGRSAIWEMDLQDRSEMQLVFSHPEVDVDDPILWPDGHIAGFEYDTDRPRTFYIDPEAQAVQSALDRLLPERFNRVIDGSRDAKKLVVLSYSDVKPEAYYLLDLTAKTLSPLGEENPELREAPLAPMKPVTVPGPEGIRIPGYLTIPPGKDPKKLPAVVYPHGGPYSRDYWRYDPVVQMMVSRGYAVLQLNFRGSTGYGAEWYDAGYRHWGTVMHDDITAGARWLIAEGIADPARMCIVGWSYGGYAALIGVTKEPDLYRCAVSIAGVSDIYQLQRDDDRFYGGRVAVQELAGDDRRELDAVSPRKNAERIKVPVLLVHGDDDIQVLVDHSKAMAKALKKAGVPNELVILDGGDHSLRRADWRRTLYGKMESFLAKHIGGT